jgi:16S rRNA (cytosine1402-N4)-methyltransferase
MENRHVPVLLNETIEALGASTGVVVDCTLGGAGHTSALLETLSEARVLACDVDPAAISAARERLKSFKDRVAFYHGNFSSLVDLSPGALPQGFAPPWGGVLMDLGYSSNQLESPEYGMSFAVDAPLDMRLSRQGKSAWDLIREASDQELGDILKAYGEMPGAHTIARRIREAVSRGEVTDSTASLARFLERTGAGRGRSKIHPATLVFQALRIAVNDELRVLDHFLDGVILKLSPRGRLAVITFHSLEDRVVKRWAARNATSLESVTRKPVTAGPEETKANPRARSAKLRVYSRR